MSILKSALGLSSHGEEANLYTLREGPVEVVMSDYGASLISFFLPSEDGGMDDILLGHSSLADFERSKSYFGATVGRFANRIADARFSLDGKPYELAANDGRNHLHGGLRGFDRHVWMALPYEEGGSSCIRFELESPDGDEGYPGRIKVAAIYRLFPDASLDVILEASADAPTFVNLTQHAYFNLKGEGGGTILDHSLRLEASRYLPVNAEMIPTGELRPVEGSPFDFRTSKKLGADIEAAGGYDHCFALDKPTSVFSEGELLSFAELEEESTGRSLLASTTLPGVQLYSGNFLEGVRGKNGHEYRKHSGLCLETQFFPDSPNHPEFPSTVLRPGQAWKHRTRYSLRF